LAGHEQYIFITIKCSEESKVIIEREGYTRVKEELPKANDTDEREEGMLPQGWALVELGSLATSISNGLTQRQTKNGKGVPVTRIETISKGTIDLGRVGYLQNLSPELIEKYRLKSGDLLFSNINSDLHLGKTALFEQNSIPLLHGMNLLLIRVDQDAISPRFLHYVCNQLRSTGLFISIAQHAVNQASINQAKLKAVKIPLAPLPEQHRIVAKIEELFTQLDAGVAALKRVKANLKRYRAAILKAACEGRLVSQDPSDEPASQLLEYILAERRAKWEAHLRANGKDPTKVKYQEPDPLEVEVLPELPEGWLWARWGQIGFSQNGRSFPSEHYQTAGAKLLRPGNLHSNGRIVWTKENTRYMPEKWAVDFPSFIVGPRELVMNLTAQSLKDEFLGRVCLTGFNERCLLNQRLARLAPVSVLPEYLLWMFKSEVFRRFVSGLNTGSLIQHMFTSQLADFMLPLPPLAEQHRIVAEVERRLSVVQEVEETVEANLKRAERLRQAILKRALEGKLVEQDPSDEPAWALLERVKGARGENAQGGEKRRKVQVKQLEEVTIHGDLREEAAHFRQGSFLVDEDGQR